MLVATLVIRGTFRRVEHVLLALSTLFATYIVAGFLAKPDWGAAVEGLVVPSMPGDSAAVLVTAAVVGTTPRAMGARVSSSRTRSTSGSSRATCASSVSTSWRER